jgi:uncharacterized protein YbjT (DUF2867 family)
MSKILVTGATGHVGSRLVRSLLSRGQSVRAFTRTGDQSRFDPQVEVVTGDFRDKASLRQALNGVSKMYLLSRGEDLEQLEANAIEAASSARGLELIVKHSVIGAQYKAADFARWHRAGEERIEATGLPYVFLRLASFDNNALYWASTIQSHDTVYGALGDTMLPVIDPEDIAEVAATVLTTTGYQGKAFDLTGPETLTTEEQVEILASVLGRPLKYVNVPDSAAREAMVGMGMTPAYADAMINLIQVLRGFGRIEPTGDVKALLGREPRSFRQWAEANSAAFIQTRATQA